MSKKYEIFVETDKTDKNRPIKPRKAPSELSPITKAHREYYAKRKLYVTSIAIDRDLWFKAKAIAFAKGETLSDILSNALREYIEKNKEVLRKIANGEV